MSTVKAVIIVPTQGKDVGAFQSVAKAVARKVYGGRAKIVTTTVTDTGGGLTVTFKDLQGKTFSWADAHHLASVVTISHAFSGDGPNLAYHDGGYQPWGSDPSGSGLSTEAKDFWRSVGKALDSKGKIILVGCFMGYGEYAKNVAKTAGVKAYGSKDLFGAANEETTLKHVKAIEAGKVKAPMVKFAP